MPNRLKTTHNWLYTLLLAGILSLSACVYDPTLSQQAPAAAPAEQPEPDNDDEDGVG